jgi:hypothetical protein
MHEEFLKCFRNYMDIRIFPAVLVVVVAFLKKIGEINFS